MLSGVRSRQCAGAVAQPFQQAAQIGGLGLAVTPRLLMFARRIFIDVYISMFFGLTLLSSPWPNASLNAAAPS